MVIDTLQLDIIVNNKGTTARINSTTKALKNLHKVISDINGAGGVNGAVNGGGGGSSSSGGSSKSSGAKGATNLAKNLTKSLNFGSMIAKLYFARNITKQLGQNLAKVVQYGIDYEETLNLWQTAMRGNISQARVFTSEMTKAYGISSATLMNYQATFKNMLAALGNISEDTAYGLSKALTQMALDFSSLYNVSVGSAMTKFQAVLSGQVRPIRTAGYDITEQTLFQLYQNLGGTKSIRQLNQTEKQLLRILAVYKQMERSGATGDLAKTITSSANQLRIMKEQGKEFATWIGVAFNTMLEKSGLLVTINGYLYALVAVAKQFAIEMGYVEKDYTIDMDFESIADANDAVDELQGKLLGFDKFQVLSSAATKDTNIEQALLNAIEQYNSVINAENNPAFQYGLELLKQWGLELDENGNIIGGFDKVKESVTEIAKGLGGMLTLVALITKPWLVIAFAIEKTYLSNETFRNSINQMFKLIGSSGLSVMGAFVDIFTSLSPILVMLAEMVNATITLLDELGLLEPTIMLVVSALLAWKAVKITSEILKVYESIKPLIPQLQTLTANLNLTKAAAVGMAVAGFMVAADAAKNLFSSWDDMSGLERAIEIFKLLAGAAMVAAVAVGVFHTSWTVGVAAAGITLGVTALMAYMQSVKSQTQSIGKFANGGTPTKGSLFYAGEAGAELVTTTSGGSSTIMNMKQLEDAVARGFIRGFASTDNGYEDNDTTEVYVDGQRLFNIMRGTAKRNGYDFVKV